MPKPNTFIYHKSKILKIVTSSKMLTNDATAPLLTVSHTLPGPAGDISEQVSSGGGQWDHLLRWQQLGVDEEEIDLATADDLEDDEWTGPDDAEEDPYDVIDEDDKIDQGEGRSKLSSDQVVEIINERIEYYTRSWRPNKGAAKGEEIQDNPEIIWDEAEATGQREQYIKSYEDELAYYKQRLDILCDQIVAFPGRNAEQVRHQCSNLEVTIDSMELADWLLSIYRLDPVDDSDDDQAPNGTIEPHSQIAAHQLKPSAEIIDLGSPSETSGGEEENAMFLDHSTEPATTIAATVEPQPPTSNASHGDDPEYASIATVLRWRWADLVNAQDRKRIVSKVVHEMGTEDRELIRTRLRQVGKSNMTREIFACVGMLVKGESRMYGVLLRDLPKIVTFTRLFLSWWFCDNCFREQPSIWHLKELQQCLDDGSSDPRTFCNYLDTIMATTFSEEALRHPERPSQAEIIEISDDDEV